MALISTQLETPGHDRSSAIANGSQDLCVGEPLSYAGGALHNVAVTPRCADRGVPASAPTYRAGLRNTQLGPYAVVEMTACSSWARRRRLSPTDTIARWAANSVPGLRCPGPAS